MVDSKVPAGVTEDHGRYTQERLYCVSKGKDYTPLDRRTISTLQIVIFLKEKLRVIDEHIKELEEKNDQKGVEGLKAMREARKAFLAKLYGFMFTETFT